MCYTNLCNSKWIFYKGIILVWTKVFVTYFILIFLCPVSFSWNTWKVVCPLKVILLHCMKWMTAVRRKDKKKTIREERAWVSSRHLPSFLFIMPKNLTWHDLVAFAFAEITRIKDLSRAFIVAGAWVTKMCGSFLITAYPDSVICFPLLTDRTPHTVPCNSIVTPSLTKQNSIVRV